MPPNAKGSMPLCFDKIVQCCLKMIHQNILLMLGPTHFTVEHSLLPIHCSILSGIQPDLKSTHLSFRSGGGGITLPLSSLTSGSMIISAFLGPP